jgi:hypothetical protein
MSSRLALDGRGRKIVVVTSSTDGLPVGYVFVVIDWGELFTPRGRPPTARERSGARLPYNAPAAIPTSIEIPDEELDEQAAVAAAYAEQRKAPPDLVNIAA